MSTYYERKERVKDKEPVFSKLTKVKRGRDPENTSILLILEILSKYPPVPSAKVSTPLHWFQSLRG